jgi:hypothetical protein
MARSKAEAASAIPVHRSKASVSTGGCRLVPSSLIVLSEGISPL